MTDETGALWRPDSVTDGDRWTAKYCERCQIQRVGECEILSALVRDEFHDQVKVADGWGRCLNFSHVVGNNYA